MAENKESSLPDLYPEQSQRDLTIASFLETFKSRLRQKKSVWLAGRLMALRGHGGILFADLLDESGRIQVVLQQGVTKEHDKIEKALGLGDFISVRGAAFLPKTNQPSLLVKEWQLLAKATKNFPKEYYKVRDEELLSRAPYLETIFYPETRQVFQTRFQILRHLRELLWQEGFTEVETPILQTHYGGAFARPFTTHLEARQQPLYLRIAPELYLKKMIVGGFEKIFEIGKNFRNEGIDRDHNPEFTALELYQAFQNREGLMALTQSLIQGLVKKLQQAEGKKGLLREFQAHKINFSGKTWPRLSFIELLKKEAGVDYFKDNVEVFRRAADKLKIEYNPKIATKGKLADELLKVVRPRLIQPVFIIDQPKEISPLAKSLADQSDLASRFQLYVGGFELANAWAELNDPAEQKARWQEQEQLKKQGDVEAQPYDETFIEALEYGLPPTAGLGIGLDRLVSLLTNQPSIKKVIYFPFVRE